MLQDPSCRQRSADSWHICSRAAWLLDCSVICDRSNLVSCSSCVPAGSDSAYTAMHIISPAGHSSLIAGQQGVTERALPRPLLHQSCLPKTQYDPYNPTFNVVCCSASLRSNDRWVRRLRLCARAPAVRPSTSSAVSAARGWSIVACAASVHGHVKASVVLKHNRLDLLLQEHPQCRMHNAGPPAKFGGSPGYTVMPVWVLNSSRRSLPRQPTAAQSSALSPDMTAVMDSAVKDARSVIAASDVLP